MTTLQVVDTDVCPFPEIEREPEKYWVFFCSRPATYAKGVRDGLAFLAVGTTPVCPFDEWVADPGNVAPKEVTLSEAFDIAKAEPLSYLGHPVVGVALFDGHTRQEIPL